MFEAGIAHNPPLDGKNTPCALNEKEKIKILNCEEKWEQPGQMPASFYKLVTKFILKATHKK